MLLNNFIFDKKYVFESNNTKRLRRKRTIIVIILLVLAAYLTTLSTIIIWGREESTKTPDIFYKSSPDLIAVYTGGAGRIKRAIDLSIQYDDQPVFISGMFSKTSLDYLSKIQQLPNETNLDLIEADRWARNTVENVISTKRFLQKHPAFKKIVIVSHDYHILRIKILIDQLISDDSLEFHYIAIESNYYDVKNLIILHKEFLKLIKSFFIVVFWEQS